MSSPAKHKVISSKQNRIVKLARSLSQRKARSRSGLWRADSIRLIEEAVRHGAIPRCIFIPSDKEIDHRSRRLLDRLEPLGVDVYRLPLALFREIGDVAAPQPMAALIPAAQTAGAELTLREGPCLIVDRVQDPANLGAIMRSALAFGAAGAVLAEGTVDPGHPRALRAAAGAAWGLPIWKAAGIEEVVEALQSSGRRLLIADGKEGGLAHQILKRSDAIVLGNEGAGVDEAWRKPADGFVCIPTTGAVESLNVAVAAGILLYEATRR